MLDRLESWSQEWQLLFNRGKCKIMHFGKNNPRMGYTMGGQALESSKQEKDLGVLIEDNLKPSAQCAKAASKANQVLGQLLRGCTWRDPANLTSLYKVYVRPHLEYANQIWSPYKVKDIESIENVQRRATKLVPSLRDLPYEDRLRKLDLPTLAYRRSRGDMIEVFKIMGGIYDSDVCGDIFEKREESTTRGHSEKIYKRRVRLNVRKYSFCERVVDVWNSLHGCVVSSRSVGEFERKLDLAWKNKEQKFNYKAGIISQNDHHPVRIRPEIYSEELVPQA